MEHWFSYSFCSFGEGKGLRRSLALSPNSWYILQKKEKKVLKMSNEGGSWISEEFLIRWNAEKFFFVVSDLTFFKSQLYHGILLTGKFAHRNKQTVNTCHVSHTRSEEWRMLLLKAKQSQFSHKRLICQLSLIFFLVSVLLPTFHPFNWQHWHDRLLLWTLFHWSWSDLAQRIRTRSQVADIVQENKINARKNYRCSYFQFFQNENTSKLVYHTCISFSGKDTFGMHNVAFLLLGSGEVPGNEEWSCGCKKIVKCQKHTNK